MKSRAAAVIVALVAGASAQVPGPTSPTSFRFERPITVTGPGPHRLAIDVPLVTAGSPFRVTMRTSGDDDTRRAVASGGLADLRLFDTSGAEIPHLLVPSPDVAPLWRAAAAVLPIAAIETERERASGFEADLGEAVTIDRFRFDRLAPPYLKRLKLEASGDRARWTLLVDEGTVFDLPDSNLRQVELGFAAGSYRYLRVTWDDTRSGRIGPPPGVSTRVVTTVSPPAALTTAVVFERRASEPGRSRFHVRLPGSRLPIIALELDVPTGHVMRGVEVYEARLTGTEAAPALIGRGLLKRIEQGTLAAAALQVAIQPPLEPELDIVVDDGNNTPLDLRGVTAVFAELPWIYFEAQGAALARYGNATLAPPRYDLEAVRQTVRVDHVASAAWGEPRARAAAENQMTAAPALPTVGATVDASRFKFVRDLPAGDAGLVAVKLDEAALAHSGGVTSRFGDVRVIDAEGRQIPYLLERSSEPLSVDVTLERVDSPPAAAQAGPNETVYRIRWPYERLPAASLVLTTSARVFQRRLSVAVERAPDRRRRDPWIDTLASASWTHAAQETPAPPLTVPLRETDAREILVTVAEGDNSVLPITAVNLLFPQYRLRFFRDAQAPLRLAYGHPDLSVPQYDLALLAPRLLGVTAADISAEAEQDQGGTQAVALMSPRLFWALLGLAVLVLVGLIVRLIRAPQI